MNKKNNGALFVLLLIIAGAIGGVIIYLSCTPFHI